MLTKAPYFHIRLLRMKHQENEALKQVVSINYALNDFKELSQNVGDYMFVENCIVKLLVLLIVFVC